MKSWKGWSGFGNTGSVSRVKDATFRHPVIVIDASDFPEGYPEIGSEWLYGVDSVVVSVVSPPACLGSRTMVAIDLPDRAMPYWVFIDSLLPLPETAKGEVVGSITVDTKIHSLTAELGGWSSTFSACPHGITSGTYDIIKRGDK